MEVEVRIEPGCLEPRITVTVAEMTDEVSALVSRLAGRAPSVLLGSRDGKLQVIREEDLIRVYAAGGRVYAVTDKGEYTLRQRLYEMEERLDRDRFVRVSNSEIIHLQKVDHFDLSVTGTIQVVFSDGTDTYVSRRYVSKIKKRLGI